jgi:hypothetical protein
MAVNPQVWTALLLTTLGALGTSLGAFLVVLHPKMQFKRLGIFQVRGGAAAMRGFPWLRITELPASIVPCRASRAA